MKGKKRAAIVILTMLILVISVTSVYANTIRLRMPVGSREKLKVVNLTYGGKVKAKWSSTNKRVAKVTKGGWVIARRPGKATIKAKVGGRTLYCKVTVYQPLQDNPEPSGFDLPLEDVEITIPIE